MIELLGVIVPFAVLYLWIYADAYWTAVIDTPVSDMTKNHEGK